MVNYFKTQLYALVLKGQKGRLDYQLLHKIINNKQQFIGSTPAKWFFVCLIPGRIGIWKCWFLSRRGTGVPGKKPLGARKRTKNKLNPHMASTPGFEPRALWREAIVLTTTPLLLPSMPSTVREMHPVTPPPTKGGKKQILKAITISFFSYYDGRGIKFCDLGLGNPNTVDKMGIEHTCPKYTTCLKDTDITLLNFLLYFLGLMQNTLVLYLQV